MKKDIKRKVKEVITCAVCGHNMGRSRCKASGLDNEGNPTWTVRCNKCKTVYTATARFPKQQTTHEQEE